MAFVGDAFRFVTSAVDARVVTPVATRLANSVANPYVLSYFLWDRVKKLTPQRARDLTRLLSTAVTNAVDVLGAEEAKQLRTTSRRLQDEVVAATATPQGKDVVLNTVATASKVAQALNTPETKAATLQIFETLQSLVDFFASDNGRKVIGTAGECVTKVCEVMASPESAVLLAEVATNICHALEAETIRRDAEAQGQQQEELVEEEVHEDKSGTRSPLSSLEDTAFETESNISELTLTPSALEAHRVATSDRRASMAASGKPKERSALRSARIEKDVLLKMGVNPSMLEEVQRILDRLRDEQEREEAAAHIPVIPEEEEEEEMVLNSNLEGTDDVSISSAFGIRSSSIPMDPEPVVDQEVKTDTEEDDSVILPDWHSGPVRDALRRRHAAIEESQSDRHALDDQSRAMTELLAKRRIAHGDLQPEDVLACRVISTILIVSLSVFMLLLFVSIARSLV